MQRFTYPVLALLAILLVSCSDNSTDPDTGGNNNGGTVGLNSTYSFVATQTDTNGNKVAQDQSYIMTVTGANQSYEGRTGVTILTNNIDHSAEYYQFADNNTVGRYTSLFVFFDAVYGSRWVDYPFSGGTTTIHWDTTITYSGTEIPVKFDGTLTYAGEETITINGTQYATRKVVEQQSGEYTWGEVNTSKRSGTYWYAPSVKQIVKMRVRSDSRSIIGGGSTITEAVMTGLSLKN